MAGITNGPRLLRGAVVATVVTAAMLAMTRLHAPIAGQGGDKSQMPMAVADPLIGALRRCQLLGQAAAGDVNCLRAWAENRRRFMAPGARPQAIVATGGR